MLVRVTERARECGQLPAPYYILAWLCLSRVLQLPMPHALQHGALLRHALQRRQALGMYALKLGVLQQVFLIYAFAA